MDDLKCGNYDPCKHDVEVLKEALGPYGVRNPENIFVHDNDATFRSTSKTLIKVKNLFKKNPEKSYAVIHLYASHGMIVSGRQVVLMNEFNKTSRFYKMLGVEQNVRDMARDHPNSFHLVFFACCREIFDYRKHCGGFPTKEEADKYYAEIRMEEQAKHLAMLQAEALKEGEAEQE